MYYIKMAINQGIRKARKRYSRRKCAVFIQLLTKYDTFVANIKFFKL